MSSVGFPNQEDYAKCSSFPFNKRRAYKRNKKKKIGSCFLLPFFNSIPQTKPRFRPHKPNHGKFAIQIGKKKPQVFYNIYNLRANKGRIPTWVPQDSYFVSRGICLCCFAANLTQRERGRGGWLGEVEGLVQQGITDVKVLSSLLEPDIFTFHSC